MEFQNLRHSHLLLRQFLLHNQDKLFLAIGKDNLERELAAIVELLSSSKLIRQVLMEPETSVELLSSSKSIRQVLIEPGTSPMVIEITFNDTLRTEELVAAYQNFLAGSDLSWEYASLRENSSKRLWTQAFFHKARDLGFPDKFELELSHEWLKNHIKSFLDHIDTHTEYQTNGTHRLSATTYIVKFKKKRSDTYAPFKISDTSESGPL